MSLRQVFAAACLGLMASAAVAACGSGGAGSATQPDRPDAAATSPLETTECVKSPSALVGKALGLAVGKVIASEEGPVTVCAYTGRYQVLVRYQVGESSGEFAQDKQSMVRLHQPVSAVSGLGDEAFFASYTAIKPASFTLAARKDGTAVFITSPASLSAERALMSELLGKV
jgi:hypothetical protein